MNCNTLQTNNIITLTSFKFWSLFASVDYLFLFIHHQVIKSKLGGWWLPVAVGQGLGLEPESRGKVMCWMCNMQNRVEMSQPFHGNALGISIFQWGTWGPLWLSDLPELTLEGPRFTPWCVWPHLSAWWLWETKPAVKRMPLCHWGATTKDIRP